MKMIERVARALCAENGVEPDFPTGMIHPVAWETYVGDARAAIAAMHEPTLEMVRCGEMWDDGAGGVYYRMIAAALDE